MFHVGMSVVCVVDPQEWNDRRHEARPQKNGIYSIRSMRIVSTGTFLLLNEIHNEPFRYLNAYEECAWDSTGFRPATERKTSIDIFRRMLTPRQVENV